MQNHGAWSEQSNGVWSSQIFLFILGGGRVGEGRESRKGVKVAWGGTKREVAEGEEEASETKGGADPRSLERPKRWCLE